MCNGIDGAPGATGPTGPPGSDAATLSEATVETYVTNGPIGLNTATTIGGVTVQQIVQQALCEERDGIWTGTTCDHRIKWTTGTSTFANARNQCVTEFGSTRTICTVTDFVSEVSSLRRRGMPDSLWVVPSRSDMMDPQGSLVGDNTPGWQLGVLAPHWGCTASSLTRTLWPLFVWSRCGGSVRRTAGSRPPGRETPQAGESRPRRPRPKAEPVGRPTPRASAGARPSVIDRQLGGSLRHPPLLALLVLSCGPAEVTAPPDAPPAIDYKADAQAFLDAYTAKYDALQTVATEAEWQAQIKMVEGDDTLTNASEKASEELAAYTGSAEVIEKARALMAHNDTLEQLQVKQLQAILFLAADNPQTVAELVKQRIEAESKQSKDLYAYAFQVDGKEVTPNEIDEKLRDSVDVKERLAYWEASKAGAPLLEPGLANLRGLRNQTVQALGYNDYYSYQVSEYEMTVEEMTEMLTRLQRELRPLYRELHTWARYELAERYGQPVPDQLPAHWLPNRWGQDWSSLVEVEGVDVDAALKDKPPEQLVKMGEDFYVSIGFPPLPQSFWDKSSLYPVPPDAGYKKNTHASAWHMDLKQDVRTLMSVEPNAEWYETSHHELGHIYYYVMYSRPEVPLLLRGGANRAFHEAVGSQMGLASLQRPFLEGRGLVGPVDPAKEKEQQIQLLLRDALSSVAFIPFAACTMPGFEKAIYVDNIPPEYWNSTWWTLVQKCQGMVPPSPRGEEFADALSKTHINDDAAQYYDYALSYFLLYQLHEHIATNILKQDVRATNYYGNKEVGAYLKGILEVGATSDWRALTREKTGKDLSAEPMVSYYAPLVEWLKEQNKGRTHTLPEL